MKKENQVLASENAINNNYELVDNGQFPYGFDNLEDSRLYNDIANVMKDNLFYGCYGDDDYVVYEGKSVEYRFDYTFDWASGELTYQITNDYDYCKGCTDCNDVCAMDKRLCDMMKWLEEHLLEIDRREWEKNN